MAEEKKFGFIPVYSSITSVPHNQIAGDYQTELLHSGGGELTEENVLADTPFFYLVLTGGTEQKVIDLWMKRKTQFPNEPVTLLAHPGNNSLPASLEILARLKLEGAKGNIIYLDLNNKDSWHLLEHTVKDLTIYHRLHKTKILLIGKPSDWLVASMPDYETIKNIWGPEIIEIDLEEFKTGIEEISDEEIEEDHFLFTNNAVEIKEPKKKEIKQVVKVYEALKKLIEKYNTNAVSVRCFDLVIDMKTTGCYALAKLNDEGIVAGCEGDLVSTLGMIWANLLTDQFVWMANPAQIDVPNNSLWLAHCTVPMKMVDKYKLRSHFESGLGVGIQGELSKGKATLFRLGGNNLNQFWISNAEIMESGSEENLCRTQVNIKLHGNLKVSDLLENPLGNHMLLLRGSYTKEMHAWLEKFIA